MCILDESIEKTRHTEHDALRSFTMASPGAAARATTVQFEVKATLLKGLIEALRTQSLLDEVMEHVQPSTRQLMVVPPAATAWIDGRVVMEIQDVVYDLRGEASLLLLLAEALRKGVSPLMRGAIQSILRLFGASPTALLTRIQQITGTTTRGVTYTYTETSKRSGVVEIRYDKGGNVPYSAFLSGRGGFTVIFELVDAKGVVTGPDLVNDARGSAGKYTLTW